MKVSENFTIQEFVTPEVYKQWGDKSIWFVDNRIIAIAQWFRTKLGKSVTINNWHAGGQFKESGLREFTTDTGAKYSQHKFGRAADLKVEGYTGDQLRQIVKDNEAELMALGLTTIEADTTTWLHVDVRFTGLPTILIVPFK